MGQAAAEESVFAHETRIESNASIDSAGTWGQTCDFEHRFKLRRSTMTSIERKLLLILHISLSAWCNRCKLEWGSLLEEFCRKKGVSP